MDLFSTAKVHIGVRERFGEDHNPEILAMLQLDSGNEWATKDEVPWCSAFVNKIAYLCGYERTGSLMARSWCEAGVEVPLKDARKNDVIVISRGSNPKFGHVGFYSHHTKDEVFILGGNQSNTVNIKGYSINRVVSIRRLNPEKE